MRKIPGHVHDFELTRTSSAAVTYHLRPSARARDGLAYHCGGWALVTVNDGTGELAVQSDWGNWAHRWNTDHIGTRPDGSKLTLTEFIADRFTLANGDTGHCDYLANKLSTRGEREEFDPDETVRAMRRILIERRLEAARAAIEYYQDEPDDERRDVLKDPPDWLDAKCIWYPGVGEEQWPYDRGTVRTIYDKLGTLTGYSDAREFNERFLEIRGYEMVTEEPWEHFQHAPSHSYEQLLHGILPALVKACAAQLKARAA